MNPQFDSPTSDTKVHQKPLRSNTSRLRRRAAVLVTIVVGALALSACTSTEPDTKSADMVLRGGVIWTGDDKVPEATAVAITKGKISFVGNDKDAKAWIGDKTEVHDLDGRFVMPGLVDSHNHPRWGAETATQCTLDWAELSVTDTLAVLQKCLDKEEAEGVSAELPFYANNWLNIGMTPRETQATAEVLDQLDTDRAVVVLAFDGHNVWANSAAITMAGITAQTPDPADGVIVRDPAGAPVGFFMDGGMTMLLQALPKPDPKVSAAQARDGVQTLYENGVTTFMEAGIFSQPDFEQAGQAWVDAIDAGDLETVRTSVYVNPAAWAADPDAAMAQMARWEDTFGDKIEMKTAKFYLDGVPDYPAQTAYMLEPYKTLNEAGEFVQGTSHGSQYMSDELLRTAATRLLSEGWALHLHALGDAGVRQALDAIEAAREANPDKLDVRHTIVHIQMMSDEDAGRFAELNTVANFQSQWFQRNSLTMDGTKGFIEDAVWNKQYPIKSIMDTGATVAAGSDWPVDPLLPFLQLQLTVTRTNPDPTSPGWEEPLGPEQSLTVEETLRMFTFNAAWAMGLDQETGTLRSGKDADLIVLDQNLLKVDPSTIIDTKVLQTVSRGKLVHGTW